MTGGDIQIHISKLGSPIGGKIIVEDQERWMDMQPNDANPPRPVPRPLSWVREQFDMEQLGKPPWRILAFLRLAGRLSKICNSLPIRFICLLGTSLESLPTSVMKS